MSFKFVLSNAGVNALTATSPNDFIFHSDYNTFKIVLTGTLSQSVATSTTTLEVTHGLGYIPLAYAFMKADTNDEAIGPRFMFLNTSPYDLVALNHVSADSTKIYFNVTQFHSSNVTIKIRYYCFEVPL